MFIAAIVHAFSRSTKSEKRSSKRTKNRFLRVEGLETRRVFDASFDSVLTIGNDQHAFLPRDVAVDAAGNNYVSGFVYGEMDMDSTVDRPDRSDVLIGKGSSDAFVAKYGPNNEFLWARRMGSEFVNVNANDPVEGSGNLTVDPSGNVYVSGDFSGTADFGSFLLTSIGNADAFVTKLDTDGNFQWAKSWGTGSREFGYGLAVDGNGNVIAVGATSSLSSNGAWTHTAAEIRKYSPSGSLSWSKSISGNGANADNVAVDGFGNVYVTGSFAGTIDMNPDPKKTNKITGSSVISGGAGRNSYILKLSSTGTFNNVAPLIAKTSEVSTSSVYISDMAIDSRGAIVIGGSTIGAVDFNPSSLVDYRLIGVPTTGSAGFVSKLNASLGFTWASMAPGGTVNALVVDATEIFTVGNFSSDFSFNGVPYTSNGGSDVAVTKLSSAGVSEWVIAFGGTYYDYGYGIAIDSVGTLSIIGTYYRTVDFDPDPLVSNIRTNAAYSDMYLLKLRRR